MKLNVMHKVNRHPRIKKETLQPLTHQDNVMRDLALCPQSPHVCPTDSSVFCLWSHK